MQNMLKIPLLLWKDFGRNFVSTGQKLWKCINWLKKRIFQSKMGPLFVMLLVQGTSSWLFLTIFLKWKKISNFLISSPMCYGLFINVEKVSLWRICLYLKNKASYEYFSELSKGKISISSNFGNLKSYQIFKNMSIYEKTRKMKLKLDLRERASII